MNDTPETPDRDAQDGGDDAADASAKDVEDNGHADALPLITRFGGIRPMAAKLGVPVSTVQGWKERDAIPVNRLEAIKAAARQHDIGLTPEDVVLQVEAETAAESDGDPQTIMAEKPADKSAADGKPRAGKLADKMPPLHQGKLVLVVSLAALVIAVLSVLASLFATRPIDPDFGAFEDRVAALEAAPATSPGAETAVDALKSRIAVLETVVDGIDSEALESRLAAAEKAAAGAAGGGDLLALADRVDAAENALRVELTAVADRVTAVERAVEADGGAAAAAGGAVAIAPAGSGAGVDLTPLTARMAALERALSALARRVPPMDEAFREAVDVAALDERLAALEQALAGIGSQPIMETDRAIGLTLAAIQLRAALGSGEAFEAPFLRARALATDDEGLSIVLAPLAPLAPKGVATLEDLRGDFDAVARILTLAAAEAEGGWTDRLIARLNAVVSVRRTDAEPGDDGIGARVARARVRLDAGDPARALAELGPPGLGEDKRVTTWRDAVAARLAVDQAIAALENFAYANLADTSTQ